MYYTYIKNMILLLLFFNSKVIVSDDGDWWKYTIIYECDVRFFKDSNGDGLGDISGLTSKMDHFVDLGIGTPMLSPLFKSSGHGVVDYKQIDPLLGIIEDFDELITKTKKKGMKVIIDFSINHSSDKHPWFIKSIDKIDPFTHYYVWEDAKEFDENGNPVPPNNWMSLFGGSTWTWNEKRKQFYYHQFSQNQPDLNLRNSYLVNELEIIMKFWLDKGVSGIRLDNAKYFMEDPQRRDEPLLKSDNPPKEMKYADYNHTFTTNLPETYEFCHRLRTFIDSHYNSDNDTKKILSVLPDTDINHTMMYLGNSSYKIAHHAINPQFVCSSTFPTSKQINDLIKVYLEGLPTDSAVIWMVENYDNRRIGTCFNEEYEFILTTLVFLLPGIAYIYYGQELGFAGFHFPGRSNQIVNPYNGERDTFRRERLPMQWDDTMNAGFTTKVKPLPPVSTNYWRINVQSQKEQNMSRYNIFKDLSKVRRRMSRKMGDFKSYIVSQWVYVFSRPSHSEDDEMLMVIINLAPDELTQIELIDLKDVISELPVNLEVVAASVNAGYQKGDQIRTSLRMRPLSVVVMIGKRRI